MYSLKKNMNKKVMEWLLDILEDEHLHRLASSHKISVAGYRLNQAPRDKLIQKVASSKRLPLIIKDLQRLFLSGEEPFDNLTELEVTLLLQLPNTDLVALLITVAFQADPEHMRMTESVMAEIEKRKITQPSKAILENHTETQILKRIEELEKNFQTAVNKNKEQEAKISKAQEIITKLRHLQKAEKGKAAVEIERNTATINLLTNSNKNYETRHVELEELLGRKSREEDLLKATNLQLNELNRKLELNIREIKAQLIETESIVREAAVASTPRLLLVGGKIAENLSHQSLAVQFLQEDDLSTIQEGFFDAYEHILLPLYNSTTVTQIRLFKLAESKIIQFNTHNELSYYIRGAF